MILENGGDRELRSKIPYYLQLYGGKDPIKPCTFSGQHAITGEDGFGEAYGYSLDYQSDRMGISGYVSVDNYYDFMNCYVEVNANPGCDAVEVTLTSLAMQRWGRQRCKYDVAYLTDLDSNKYDNLCGCIGDGCSDLVWGRKVMNPFYYDNHPYYDEYYTYVNYNSYDSYGAADYDDTYMMEFWKDAASGTPRKDKWRLSGNGFRLNIQSDDTQSHGEIKLEWTCVEDSTTTTATSTTATTTTATTTTTASTTTVTTATSTTTTEYYDRYTTYSTGTTTLTTSSVDSTWNPYMTTEGDTSCAMFHNGLDSFFSQVGFK